MYDVSATMSAGQAASVLGTSLVAGGAARSVGLATTGSSIAALVFISWVLIGTGVALLARSRARRRLLAGSEAR